MNEDLHHSQHIVNTLETPEHGPTELITKLSSTI